jgi:ribosomal protein L22
MSPGKPGTPSEGKPDDAKIAQDAADAKTASAEDEALVVDNGSGMNVAAEAEAVPDKPKPKRARRKPAAAEAKADKPAKAAKAEATAGDAKPKTRRSPRRGRAEADKPAAPATKTRRATRDYGDNPPMVRAHAKYVRTSARKARLVCDHIRGKSVEEARAILAHASRDVARDWSKLLESAVANAEHNHELIGDELRIAAVKADEGPTLKRFRPRAMGRATKIRKRTSHLSITLTPMDRDR